jgi:hypothetical protein
MRNVCRFQGVLQIPKHPTNTLISKPMRNACRLRLRYRFSDASVECHTCNGTWPREPFSINGRLNETLVESTYDYFRRAHLFSAASCGDAEHIKAMHETIGCNFGWVDENDDGSTVLHRLEASRRDTHALPVLNQ